MIARLKATITSTIKPSVQMQMHRNCSLFVQKGLLICIKNGIMHLHMMTVMLWITYPEQNVACMLQVTRGKQPCSKLRRNLCQDCSTCCKKWQQHSTPPGMARSCLETQAFLHYLQHKSYSRVEPVAPYTGVPGSVTLARHKRESTRCWREC